MASGALHNRPLKILLDGRNCVGKSVLLNCLRTGSYTTEGIVHTTVCEYHNYDFIVKGEKFKTTICDTNGSEKEFLITNFEHYSSADVIVECFSINNVSTLRKVITFRIPLIRCNFPKTPILLVGTKSDVRMTTNPKLQQQGFLPSIFGNVVAQSVGAFKYVECSAKKNFNVCKVFEEAICAVFPRLGRYSIGPDLNTMLMDKMSLDTKWLALVKEAKIDQLFPAFDSFQKDLEKLDEQFSQIKLGFDDLSFQNVYNCRSFEFERILISHSFCGHETNFNEYPQPQWVNMWYTPDYQNENHASQLCQPLCDENFFLKLESSQRSRDPVNLFFHKQTCKSINELLTEGNNLCIRSLVIVDCDGKLIFSFLSNLIGLKYLVVKDTNVDIKTLTFPSHFRDTMKHLVLINCGIIEQEVPSIIGMLKNLELLNIAKNKFKRLPIALSSLQNVHLLNIDLDNMVFPPPELLNKSAHDVFNYLAAIREDPIENKKGKLIVVGQEEVGKSTLIKAIKRNYWMGDNDPPPKTDGVDISVLCLENEVKCNVYDLAGDVEYLNTHSLFLSSKCLYLAVFDLSQFIASTETRSADHLCRLELWLQTIASQNPQSYVIIVGTHADHSKTCQDILTENRKLINKLFERYGSTHRKSKSSESCEECMICNSDKVPECLKDEACGTASSCSPCENDYISYIPHILGYFEVSGVKKYPPSHLGFSNINLEKLKSQIAHSIRYILKVTESETVPKKWVSFDNSIMKTASTFDSLKEEPVIPLTRIQELALENEIYNDETVIAMLRFFHSQGTFLWYEDMPELKDVVLTDPQWLSNKLRTLISHESSVDSICDGIISLKDLPKVWPEISLGNRSRLLCLFRKVGLCFSISDSEDLFPCNLPIGWPNEDKWPPLPNSHEKQTSLLFAFSFVPPSFFPSLIVEVNKKHCQFFCVPPLYYRFHIVYMTKEQGYSKTQVSKEHICEEKQDGTVTHRVHYEMMPYNNTLKVSVRGPSPRSIFQGIRSTINSVKSRLYPGMKCTESLLCPECVMRKNHNPATFGLDASHDGVCSNWHKVGSNEDILDGKLCPRDVTLPNPNAKNFKILEDHICPKTFVILPINHRCLALQNQFVHSHLRDGFAVHLICECPGQMHFVDSPGFRIGKPKQSFAKFGAYVNKSLRLLAKMPVPYAKEILKVAATSLAQWLESLLEDDIHKHPHLEINYKKDIKELTSSTGLSRSELSRLLQVKAENRKFGPLVCTFVQKYNETLWLCKEHSERFSVAKK